MSALLVFLIVFLLICGIALFKYLRFVKTINKIKKKNVISYNGEPSLFYLQDENGDWYIPENQDEIAIGSKKGTITIEEIKQKRTETIKANKTNDKDKNDRCDGE